MHINDVSPEVLEKAIWLHSLPNIAKAGHECIKDIGPDEVRVCHILDVCYWRQRIIQEYGWWSTAGRSATVLWVVCNREIDRLMADDLVSHIIDGSGLDRSSESEVAIVQDIATRLQFIMAHPQDPWCPTLYLYTSHAAFLRCRAALEVQFVAGYHPDFYINERTDRLHVTVKPATGERLQEMFYYDGWWYIYVDALDAVDRITLLPLRQDFPSPEMSEDDF